MVALSCGVAAGLLQCGRMRDVGREYAYAVAQITMVLAALSDFYEADWRAVKLSVWWRVLTIVAGVVIATFVCVLVLPVYAAEAVRDALSQSLVACDALLRGVLEVCLVDEDGDGRVDGCGAQVVAGQTGLDALEEGIGATLERLRPALAAAREEANCTSAPLACDRYERAAGRARLLYTGGMSLKHFLSADTLRIRLCVHHAGAICAARDAVSAATAALAARIAASTPLTGAEPELAAAEAAVAVMLGAVAADPQSQATGEQAEEAAAVTAADVEALGQVVFVLSDALRQLKLLVVDLDDDGPALLARLLPAAGPLKRVAGRRVSTVAL